MKVLGITGGVGAGKSRVLEYLRERYGAYTVEADQVGHQLMEPGGSCYSPVVQLLGEGILDTQGRIDRKEVASLVFPRKESLEKLNHIIHPAVKQEIRRRIAQQEREGRKLFVVEAALLLEDRYWEICGEIWHISVSGPVRRQRLKAQRGYSGEMINDILKNQLSEEAFQEKCDYTVDNDGDWGLTRRQIDQRIEEYGIM